MRVTSWLPMNVCGTNVSSMSLWRPRAWSELEQVSLLQRAADRLPQLVLGDGIHARGGHNVGVLAVDHLTHDIDIREAFPDLGQYPRPKRRWHGVGRVQTPAVGTRGEPTAHHSDDVISDSGFVVVQRDQHLMALEPRPATILLAPEPRPLRAARLDRQGTPESPARRG